MRLVSRPSARKLDFYWLLACLLRSLRVQSCSCRSTRTKIYNNLATPRSRLGIKVRLAGLCTKAGTTEQPAHAHLSLCLQILSYLREEVKLQQGQCLICLLVKQNSLLQHLIATTTSRTSSPAHADRLPGCNMTTAQSVSITKGSTTQHDNPCEHVHCFLSLVITLLKRTFLVQNQLRENITAAAQKTGYPSPTSQHRDSL